jgi:hypothetical protein
MPQVKEPGCVVAFQAARDAGTMCHPRHATSVLRERVAHFAQLAPIGAACVVKTASYRPEARSRAGGFPAECTEGHR